MEMPSYSYIGMAFGMIAISNEFKEKFENFLVSKSNLSYKDFNKKIFIDDQDFKTITQILNIIQYTDV